MLQKLDSFATILLQMPHSWVSEPKANLTFANSGSDPILTVTNSGHAQLTLTNTSGSDHCEINFGDSDDHDIGEIIYTNSSDRMAFIVNAAERLVIGKTGISTFSETPHDQLGSLRSVPRNSKSSAYVLIASDAGKCITITTGGVTINPSVMSSGDVVTIINDSGSSQTITQGSSMTLYNTADGSTGNKTLTTRGMSTVWFTSNNNAYITGNFA